MSSPASPELDPETFVLRRVGLRQLRMLVALDKEGSLSAAAERLHVTQPAVSKTLAELDRVTRQEGQGLRTSDDGGALGSPMA